MAGPAKDEPIFRDKFHYDWHWNWNTGNGELGNWGPHILDDLRNVVFRDKVKLPKRVIAGSSRFSDGMMQGKHPTPTLPTSILAWCQ